MHYPVAIENGTDAEAFGVVVPDLPGCFSAGDTLEEAFIQTEEAITGWIETALDAGQEIPKPSGIEALRKAHPEYEGWTWGLVKVARLNRMTRWSALTSACLAASCTGTTHKLVPLVRPVQGLSQAWHWASESEQNIGPLEQAAT